MQDCRQVSWKTQTDCAVLERRRTEHLSLKSLKYELEALWNENKSAHSRNAIKQLQFSKIERQTKALWNKNKVTFEFVQVHTLSWVQLCCINRMHLMSNQFTVAKLAHHKQLSNGGQIYQGKSPICQLNDKSIS
ncbi:unnamed protein product [Dicrocoelium dendriticum]|nr:unnamed protein product [Dicrocoelium dendriticum]